jgi:tetratricopeptide (TPR) repeat protein
MARHRYTDAVGFYESALKLDPQASRLQGELADAYQATGNATAANAARSKSGNVAPALADPLAAGALSGTVATAAPTAGSSSGTATGGNTVAEKATLAALNLQSHDYATARKTLDEALKLKPGDAVLLALYARVEAAAGNLGAANTRARAAVAAAPDNALAEFSLGLVHDMSRNDPAAQKAYEKALAADPDLDDARVALANLFMRTSRPGSAAGHYRELTKRHPDQGEAWARLVAAEVADGHCAVALKTIETALAARPDYGYLMQLNVRLSSTCPAATSAEHVKALDQAARLYGASSAAPVAEAYALALAAAGKWDDAVKMQGAAMFDLLRKGR